MDAVISAIDLQTVMLLMAVGYFAFGMILLVHRPSGPQRRMLNVWMVVQFAKSAATLCIALRGAIPDYLSSIGGNGLTFIGFSLELLVFRYYVFRHWHIRLVGAIGGILLTIFLVDALLLAPHPTAGNAALIVSCGLALLTLLNGTTLLQAKWPRAALLYLVAASNLLVAGTAALRAYTLLTVDVPSFSTLVPNQLMFHAAFLLMLVNGVGFLLLVKQESDDELKRLSTTDPLTGLLNRRAFMDQTEHAQRISRRTRQPLALALVDLDHFKRVNDRYGHAAGDTALEMVAELMRVEQREVDIIGRIGGEEFAITLPGATPEQAMRAADRLRVAIATIRLTDTGGAQLITMSAGITSLDADESCGKALARADAALYEAKRRGRDTVVVG